MRSAHPLCGAEILVLSNATPHNAQLRIIGRRDLEIHVGLAARFGDLAPAGADLVTVAGIDPVIGRLVGGLVDRDDGERGG